MECLEESRRVGNISMLGRMKTNQHISPFYGVAEHGTRPSRLGSFFSRRPYRQEANSFPAVLTSVGIAASFCTRSIEGRRVISHAHNTRTYPLSVQSVATWTPSHVFKSWGQGCSPYENRPKCAQCTGTGPSLTQPVELPVARYNTYRCFVPGERLVSF